MSLPNQLIILNNCTITGTIKPKKMQLWDPQTKKFTPSSQYSSLEINELQDFVARIGEKLPEF